MCGYEYRESAYDVYAMGYRSFGDIAGDPSAGESEISTPSPQMTFSGRFVVGRDRRVEKRRNFGDGRDWRRVWLEFRTEYGDILGA